MTQARADDLIGRTIGGSYRIEKKLGEGGMGAVFRAHDVNLDRPCALKVIRPELGSREKFVKRFQREAKAAARFKHPNSVDIYAFGEDQGLLYMALELVNGRELTAVIREKHALPVTEALAFAIPLLHALNKAHELGIVHRDLKPQNIMIALEDGVERVKILDFGLAKLEESEDGAALTQQGAVMGTLAYMSPEQAKGEPVDARTDIYAVGIMVYEMLTGEVPFRGSSGPELIRKQIQDRPVPPRTKRPDLPEALEAAILRALAKDPADRFPDAATFSRALEAVRVAVLPSILLPDSFSPDAPTRTGEVTPISTPPTDQNAPTVPSLVSEPTLPPPVAARVGSSLEGTTFDEKYEIQAKLGEGAMGAVFRARHKLLDKLVALKVVHPGLAGRTEVRERFFREAKAALEFVHPNAVPVREFGETKDGLLYMTQDLSVGKSLRAILDEAPRKRLEVARALDLVRQCLLALGEAHAHGIVHRDVKPENILVETLARGGELARVCDFGISKLGALPQLKSEEATRSFVGTPHYMAPEQAQGTAVDGRADLYAIGCVLHELLTGAKVFEGDAVWAVIMKHMEEAPVPPSRRGVAVPPGLDALVLKALEKDPAARPQTAASFVAAIDALSILERPRRDRLVALGIGVVTLVVVAVLSLPPSTARARRLYAEATRAGSPESQLALLAAIPPSQRTGLPEIARLNAIALLALAAKDPPLAAIALRDYAHASPPDDDALTARFVAAFVERWSLGRHDEWRRELVALAAVAPTESSARAIPLLAACALRLEPLGASVALDPKDSAAWLEAAQAARAADGPLERLTPPPVDDDGARPVGYHAGWIATILEGRLESAAGDASAIKDLEAGASAFPCFATHGAVALELVRTATDPATRARARSALLALRTERGKEPFGEGALALAGLALDEARDAAALESAVLEIRSAAAENAATPGLDLDPLARRLRLRAAAALGSAVRRDGATPELRARAATALTEALREPPLEPALGDEVARAHVTLGLLLAADETRRAEAAAHLVSIYPDGDPARGYRTDGAPENAPASELVLASEVAALEQAFAAPRFELEPARARLARIEAIARLTGRELPFVVLARATLARREADDLSGSEKDAALGRARSLYENALGGPEWDRALRGRTEAALELARTKTDPLVAASLLDAASAFIDGEATRSDARERAPTLAAARTQVRAVWFTLLERRLALRDDTVALSPDDRKLLDAVVAVAQTSPEPDAHARGMVAHARFLIGKDLFDRGRWTEALPHLLAAASCQEPTEEKACSAAARVAATIAWKHASEVDRAKAPWGYTSATARPWGRSVIARRLGQESYDALVTAALAGKLGPPVNEPLARFLVDDILDDSDSNDAIVLATRIDARYPRAHLALARKRLTQRNLPEARAAAKLALELSDESTPAVTVVEAAHIYFLSCDEDEVATPAFLAAVDRAQGLATAAAALWKNQFGLLPHAYAPLYWKGRHEEALQHFRAAEVAYEAFKEACETAGVSHRTAGEGDVVSRIQSCANRAR